MGYVPLFDHLTTGTLYGKWPDIGLWPVLLSMADKHGKIDVTPQFIAGVTGLGVDEVTACIQRFCSEDEFSRTRTDGGRRLEPISWDRAWGWRVVNHAAYREKARLLAKDQARTNSGVDAERKRASRERPPLSPEVPLSDADADAYSDSDSEESKNSEKRKKTHAARAIALPEDFDLNEDRKVYAEKNLPNVNTKELFSAFRDYHLSKGTTAKDWAASWRMWVRNSLKFGYPMLLPKERPVEKPIRYDARGNVRHDN